MGRGPERRPQWRALGVLLVAVLLLAAACGGGSSKKAKARKKEVFREPVTSATNLFTPPAGTDQNVPPVQPQGASTQSGGQVGLFGGTMNQSSCNKEQLITFLEQNPDKGRAWASTFGINFTDIRTYVTGLTSVLLRSDTRVTNHGWKNGKITNIQVVLQAGTAVLVDEKGFPVVRCYCGNSLTPPEAYPPRYSGPKWDYFKLESLAVIEKNVTIIDIFVLVDPKTGQSFQRPRWTDGAQDMLFGVVAQPETTPRTTPRTTATTPPTTHPPTTTHSTSTTSHTPST
jgi:hypothetical protein